MEICYELFEDDIVAFNEIHARRSPTYRKVRVQWFFMFWFLGVVMFSLISISVQSPTNRILLILIGPLLLPLRYWFRTLSRTKKWVRQILAEGENKGLFTERTVSLEPSGIRQTSSRGESTSYWSAIERLVVNDAYAFIYLDAFQAIILPRRVFDNEVAFEQFVSAISSRTGLSRDRV